MVTTNHEAAEDDHSEIESLITNYESTNVNSQEKPSKRTGKSFITSLIICKLLIFSLCGSDLLRTWLVGTAAQLFLLIISCPFFFFFFLWDNYLQCY